MKTVATLITAATLAVATTAASAWYAPYGYAPYGYGVPVAPAAELTEEQKQAMADQQAKAAEYFQAMQKQAYEFHAAQFAPIAEMERKMFEQRNTDMQEMYTRMQEMHAEMQKNIQESMQNRVLPPFGYQAPTYDRAAIDAERVQLEQLARVVLVEATLQGQVRGHPPGLARARLAPHAALDLGEEVGVQLADASAQKTRLCHKATLGAAVRVRLPPLRTGRHGQQHIFLFMLILIDDSHTNHSFS